MDTPLALPPGYFSVKNRLTYSGQTPGHTQMILWTAILDLWKLLYEFLPIMVKIKAKTLDPHWLVTLQK